jgi:F-type H+-transporting ATPase subunit b
MKRVAAWMVVFGLTALGSAVAQERPEKAEEKAREHASEASGEGEHGGMEIWKWANFAILAGGLGYLIGKNAGPFFAARTQQIRKDMIESGEMRKQAEARAAEVDGRLAHLETEIAALRAEAKLEADAETERLARQTAAEIGKVQLHAEQDIAAAGKAARMELKRYSAELAVQLAEQKIRGRMSADVQNSLVMSFVKDLDGANSRAQAT